MWLLYYPFGNSTSLAGDNYPDEVCRKELLSITGGCGRTLLGGHAQFMAWYDYDDDNEYDN